MKKVVILGAGLATRLFPITKCIPKVLVNYKQHTILYHLHKFYKNVGAEEIIVVVHSKFKDLVLGYAKIHGLDITVRTVDEANGSAYAIHQIRDDVVGHNVVFNWCDIIPVMSDFKWNESTIYTSGDECRYGFDGQSISRFEKTGGNVIGMYQYAYWGGYATEPREVDFVDKIVYASKFKKHDIGVIDLGDMPKLIEAHKERELNREFNQVIMHDNYVEKKALNNRGLTLLENELNWYKNVKSSAVPEIIDSTVGSFTMSRIKGKPAFEYVNNFNAFETVNRILDSLNFGEPEFVDTDVLHADIKYEAYTKVIERCESIKPILDSFGEIKMVNGIKIQPLEPMLKRALKILCGSEHSYQIIHGDPNFSNTMIEDDGTVKFIDPRGYFGHTKLRGLKTYDEAKVLYALSGYDRFNADYRWGKFGVYRETKSATVHIDVGVPSVIHDIKKHNGFGRKHDIWVAIIWIALAGYFKNNPLKAVAAYYHGMKLLSIIFSRNVDGDFLPELAEPITASIITKCPEKWILHDTETGVKYKPTGLSEVGKQWKAISD